MFNVWKIYSNELFRIYWGGGVNDTEIATENFERYKSPGIEQILIELIQAIEKHFILFGLGKNCHTNGNNLLLYLVNKAK
jgi:hypothetical protein